jgi:hypothetical protein
MWLLLLLRRSTPWYVASYNHPGSMHDSEIAHWGDIYTKLDDQYERTGGKCVVDSAFCGIGRESIIKSVQDCHNTETPLLEMAMYQQATSVRQSAEWGMHGFQGSFPRLKTRLLYEERGERALIICSIILLYNYRTNKVGLNQIQSVYMPHIRDVDGASLFYDGLENVPGDEHFQMFV